MNMTFDHEKLHVYQEAIHFVAWTHDLLTTLPKTLAVHSQLDRAATSIPLNIAEGNGKYTAPDRCRFFDIARGSALECSACLDVLKARQQPVDTAKGKEILVQIVFMLVGLIQSTSPDRVYDKSAIYSAEEPIAEDQDEQAERNPD